MSDESQEKQHAASGKRLADLKKQGTVLRSRDLSSGLIFISTIIFLMIFSYNISETIKHNFISSFTHFDQIATNKDLLFLIIKNNIKNTFFSLLPIFIGIFIIALLTPFLFGGWNFSIEIIMFKFSKLNPINNLGKIFSPGKALTEIARSFVKTIFLLIVMIIFLYSNINELMNFNNESIYFAVFSGYQDIKRYLFLISISLVAIIIFDAVYHYFLFQQQVKMSTQELKDEQKESDGRPEYKQRIRSRQLALSKQRISQAVPSAHVVITNPSHYAVALKYDSNKDRAPIVVAKGKDYLAAIIKNLSIAHGVTIYQSPGLARAIYHTTKVGLPVDPALYTAVATVLSYVYQLKNYQLGQASLPTQITDFDLPEKFIYKE